MNFVHIYKYIIYNTTYSSYKFHIFFKKEEEATVKQYTTLI